MHLFYARDAENLLQHVLSLVFVSSVNISFISTV